jgi:hypothetical protein
MTSYVDLVNTAVSLEVILMKSTTRLFLEALDERTLPSSTSTIPAESVVPSIYQPQLHLDSMFHGDYSVQPVVTNSDTDSIYQITTDAGTTYQFSGSSTLPRLGDVAVSGNITTVSNVMFGHATGQLTLTSANGQMTIEVTGPLQNGGSALPGRYTYRVTSATGDLASLKPHGYGIVNLSMISPHQAANLPNGHFLLAFA